jgi:hypothetical protein
VLTSATLLLVGVAASLLQGIEVGSARIKLKDL